MKIINLTEKSKIYTSNVYFVLGTWNALADVNTLIDVGRDVSVIKKINECSTGVGKRRVEQVILTHSHYDHVSFLPKIKEIFRPKVYAFSPILNCVDYLLKDGEILKIGDKIFEVIYTPGHSNDSICLYCEDDHVLFSGDTPIIIFNNKGSYERRFVQALENLSNKDIRTIYFGHSKPLFSECNQIIRKSVENVKRSKIF